MVQQVLDPITRLKADVRAAAVTLTPQEARYLVDYYYIMQEDRKRAGNQVRALQEAGEPHSVVAWTFGTAQTIERNLKSVLGIYAEQHVPGRWAMSIRGIGPIIASGLLAHVDPEICNTVGKLWRFAGLDPTAEWKKGQKRPHNARLKVICWHIGESFVKQQNSPDDIYGKLYVQRKAYETARNDGVQLADQARIKLEKFEIGKDTEAYKWYIKGMLPPAHIHARAKRWVVKLFLAHYQHVAYEDRFGSPPPKPYILTQPGHNDFIAPPNWPTE